MIASKQMQLLIERLSDDRKSYISSEYNEAQGRTVPWTLRAKSVRIQRDDITSYEAI
jgi:hypothetical protein